MPTNPFSAARFAPDRIPWLASDESAAVATLLDRAARPGARHQILGAKGSGKTTLLRHIEVEAARRGHAVIRFRGSSPPPLLSLARELRAGSFGRGAPSPSARPAVVLVDEHAELGHPVRFLLRHAPARVAVVVTTHVDLGLPTLHRCEATPRVARHVIDALLGRPTEASTAELEVRLARHAANLREVLFELYDEVERSGPELLASG